MKIIRDLLTDGNVTLEEFADANGLTLHVTERRDGCDKSLFIVGFPNVRIAEGGMVCSAHGYGCTEEEATRNFVRNISGRRIKLETNTYVDVPKLRG